MLNKLDTHFYDGKISAYAETILSKISPPNIPFEEAIQALKWWSGYLNYPEAIKTLELIEREKGNKNFDPTDNLNTEYLVVVIWDKIKKEPQEYKYIFEQLSDVTTSGPCVMGRVKRLFQVVKSLYD